MSTTSQLNPDPFVEGDAYSARNARTGRNKPAQLATRTKWSLDDILDEMAAGHADLQAMLKWIECERMRAKGRFDCEKLAGLGEFSRLMCRWALRLGQIERMATDARRGEYRGPQIEGGTE